MKNLRTKVLFSLVFAAVVLLALTVYADLPHLVESLAAFRWGLVPIILALTLANYLIRGIKYGFYLRQIGVRDVSRPLTFLLFFSGLSMVITPGKVGEWLKSYLLRELNGTPIARSAPIVLAERMTDAVALMLLAIGGLVIFHVGWQILGLVAALALVIVFLSQYRPLAERLFKLGERLPLLATRVHHAHRFYDSAATLFAPRNLAIAVGLGFISWLGECLAFFLVLVGLGQTASPLLFFQAAFMLATSILIGSLLLVPGGLGVAEGGITGLAVLLLGMSQSDAVAAALLIRVCTLWFGVTVGLVAFVTLTRRLDRIAASRPDRRPRPEEPVGAATGSG